MLFYTYIYIYIYIYIIKNELVVKIILLIQNNTLHMKSSDAKASKLVFNEQFFQAPMCRFSIFTLMAINMFF